MNSKLFIRENFAKFYNENINIIKKPNLFEKREFGFFLFEKNLVIRHKSFIKIDDLRSFFQKIVPAHAYYSSAYYENPEKEMQNKDWIGADLFFDIDADHIPTECKKKHDKWVCRKCGFLEKGVVPPKCVKCGQKNFKNISWTCETCLEAAKLETIKLIDIIIEDFGFTFNDFYVSFSGNRGYHVQLFNLKIRELNSKARKEIVDYVTGSGLEPSLLGLNEYKRPKFINGPNIGDVGWRGRIAKGVYEFLLSPKKSELKKLGLKNKSIDHIYNSKNIILKSWEKKGPWNLGGLDLDSWKAIVNRGIESQSTLIDTAVTIDTHRLVRMPNTLHGKTGLLKIRFPGKEIEKFDPFKKAIAFHKGEVEVHIDETPEFRVGDEVFGPYKDKKIELPLAAALLLLCKGLAEVQ